MDPILGHTALGCGETAERGLPISRMNGPDRGVKRLAQESSRGAAHSIELVYPFSLKRKQRQLRGSQAQTCVLSHGSRDFARGTDWLTGKRHAVPHVRGVCKGHQSGARFWASALIWAGPDRTPTKPFPETQQD